jgi:TetR/AcrR family fatty acid metabolism transcriptional regulator
MNIHSVMAAPAAAPGAAVRRPRADPRGGAAGRRGPADRPAAPKRAAILRAAIDVFADCGYFNAQVADVARSAGVAAGTVYLYFRSKDDLLVSIFERSMREALAEGRALVAGLRDPRDRLRGLARLHLARLGRDRHLAIVFQVELRQSTKFMERFSSTLLRDYLGLIRDAVADGQREGLFRPDVKPTVAAKILFGALDEMATNWILSRRRYSLEADAETVVEIFVNGTRAR